MSENIRSNKVSRNTLLLTIAYTVQKVISFGYFIYYARYIGYINTGKFVFAVSFVTIFGILVDLGLNPVLIREVARTKEKAKKYLSAVFTVKFYFALISLLLIFVSINLLRYPPETRNLVYLVALVMIFESFSLSLFAIFRGYQNLKYEAIGTIIYQFLVVGAGVTALQFTHNPIVLGVAVLLGALGNFIYALVSILRKTEARPAYKLDFGVIRHLLKLSMPFFLAGIFIKIYAYIDILLLSFLKRSSNGDQYVGWYSVAYKLTYAIQFIPLAFNNSIYPALSRFYIESKELLTQTIQNAFRYLMVIALPISLGAFVLADKITVLFTDDFANSIPAFRISILGLVFIFVNFILSSSLNASNRQKTNTINLGLTVVFNIVVNLILIPKFNHIGASIAALSSAIFLFILGYYQTSKYLIYQKKVIISWFLRSLMASLVMSGTIFWLKDFINFLILIPIGVIIYVIMILVIRVITRQEIISLLKSLKNR